MKMYIIEINILFLYIYFLNLIYLFYLQIK